MRQIAHIESPFKEKFGVPRQAGLAEGEARVVFEPEYRVSEAVRGLEQFDYVWLIWEFHLNKREKGAPRRGSEHLEKRKKSSEEVGGETWSPTVRPPRLGGNKRVGVFATRSPFRPNPIGLSSVRLVRIEPGPVLVVSGADLVDGTPIFDIKPYLPYADSHPEARSGFATGAPEAMLEVADPGNLLAVLPEELRQTLRASLAQDPRPHYQEDSNRLYSMSFDRYEVRFKVDGASLEVAGIDVKKS